MSIKNNIIINAILVVSVILFLIQPAFSWFISDDYCIMEQVQHDGIISSWFHDYLYWDGRSISLTYPVCRIGLFAGVPWLGPLLGSLLMFVMAILMLLIAGDAKSDKGNRFTKIVTVTILLWLVYFNFLSQTLYWTTGVGYNMDVAMLLAAVWWMSRWQGKSTDFFVGLPIFFYAGTCSPNGVLALLFVFFIQWLHAFLIQGKQNHIRYAYAFFFIIVAMSFVIFSPGNKNRMTAWDWNNLTHFWTVYFNIKLLIKNLFNFNSIFIWPLIAIGLTGGTLKVISANAGLSGILKRVINACYVHRFFFAAAISFFFFLPFPTMNSPRTAIQFAAFATLYGLGHLPYLLSKVADKREAFIKYAIIIINLIFIITAASQAFDARYVKAQLVKRDAKLRALKGTDVVLTEADYLRTPATRRFEDLASDSSYWLNRCVAGHYGLKSIKLIDTRPKKVVMGVMTD